MGTATGRLARSMAACKRDQMETLRDLHEASRIAVKRHDESAEQMLALSQQTETPEGHGEQVELAKLQRGLLGGIGYAKGMHEVMTGEPKKEPVRHDVRDAGNRFTKKGTWGHRLRELILG